MTKSLEALELDRKKLEEQIRKAKKDQPKRKSICVSLDPATITRLDRIGGKFKPKLSRGKLIDTMTLATEKNL